MTKTVISPLASVHPDAEIGQGVQIAPFAVVEAGTVIGDGTIIHSGAQVRYGARIGRECNIHPGAIVSGIPQDLKFAGEDTLAIVGDYTQVRECVTINRGTASKGHTIVGSHCLLMAYSHIAHDCELGDNVIIGNVTQLAGEVIVEDYAIVSGGTLAHQFSRIGQHAMIQGGSRISKDIPPYSLVGREPLIYCGINVVGLRRRGFSSEQIHLINDVYRIIYQRGLNMTNALAAIEQELPDSPERNFILDFVKGSERGVVRGSFE